MQQVSGRVEPVPGAILFRCYFLDAGRPPIRLGHVGKNGQEPGETSPSRETMDGGKPQQRES